MKLLLVLFTLITNDNGYWLGVDYTEARWKILNNSQYKNIKFENGENVTDTKISFVDIKTKNQPITYLEFKNDTCIKMKLELPISLYDKYMEILASGYVKKSGSDKWADGYIENSFWTIEKSKRTFYLIQQY